jgi:hypothetical protein
MALFNRWEGLIQFVTVPWRLDPVSPRTKQKTSEKPASPRKATVAKLVPPPQGDIDDDADDRQRVGVQSLGRAFAILEEVARHREGIGLADLSKLVDLHNSTTFHLAKTMVSLGYLRQEKDSKRYRVGRPLFALAASALDEIEMVNVATPVLEELSRETGESGHFAVRMGDAVVVIARRVDEVLRSTGLNHIGDAFQCSDIRGVGAGPIVKIGMVVGALLSALIRGRTAKVFSPINRRALHESDRRSRSAIILETRWI